MILTVVMGEGRQLPDGWELIRGSVPSDKRTEFFDALFAQAAERRLEEFRQRIKDMFADNEYMLPPEEKEKRWRILQQWRDRLASFSSAPGNGIQHPLAEASTDRAHNKVDASNNRWSQTKRGLRRGMLRVQAIIDIPTHVTRFRQHWMVTHIEPSYAKRNVEEFAEVPNILRGPDLLEGSSAKGFDENKFDEIEWK